MFGNSLRTRILFALLLLSLVPALTIAYQGYHCGRMAVTDLMRLHVESVAESRQTMIAEKLKEWTRTITTLTHLPVMVQELSQDTRPAGEGPVKELEGVLEAVYGLSDQYESIVILDQNWQVLASSSHGESKHSGFDDPEFRSGVAAAAGVFFDSAHTHGLNEVGSHFGSPIRNTTGVIIGYIVGNINFTSSLTPLVQDRSGLWNSGKSYILDAGGRFITQPFIGGPRQEFAHEHDTSGVNQEAAAHDRLSIYEDFRGVEVIGASLRIPLHDWRLIVEIDLTEAMTWVQVLMLRAAITVALSLFAVLILSTWLSGVVGAPLARLANMAHRIAEGHMEERLEPMRLQEADDVGQAVNHMLDELREKEKTIVSTATLATVGELTSRVVHEMRNPLSSIKMNIQSLLGNDTQNEQNCELAEIAFGQVVRLESMLNELLQYGRPLALNMEKTSAGRLLETATDSVAPVSAEHGVSIKLVNTAADDRILADAEQLQRAVANLLVNAIEASSRGGIVSVSIEDAVDLPGGVRIAVSDTGIGIHEGNTEKLFKPFFTTKSNGIGLGLANVKKIVGLHGGVVGFSNAPAGGTQFTIELPNESVRATRAANDAETGRRSAKILST